ncbi:hypothetical protein AMK16_21405 [Streptomyces sp. CB00455]|nr:hypothetical protein AMK16_21405 [Streptomyces sp. CB00455]
MPHQVPGGLVAGGRGRGRSVVGAGCGRPGPSGSVGAPRADAAAAECGARLTRRHRARDTEADRALAPDGGRAGDVREGGGR